MSWARAIPVAALTLFASAVAFGQTGSLDVFVIDASSSPIADASVSISEATGRVVTRSVQTDDDGRAAFPVLPPGGDYTILVEVAGASPVRHSHLSIRPGATLSVRVTADDSDNERPRPRPPSVGRIDTAETVTRFSDDLIEGLPIQGRFYQGFLTIIPGVNDVTGRDDLSVHGARPRDFDAFVDGVRFSDPIVGGWLGRVNPGTIEEIEVVTAGAGVEIGRSLAGYTRILQPQGNNGFDAQVGFLYGSSKLDGSGADNPDQTAADPDFGWIQPSAMLSGPLVRERLWFSAAFESIRADEPINTTTGIDVTETDAQNGFGRLTWQVSPRNRLSFHLQSNASDVDNFGVSSTRPSEAALARERDATTVGLTWSVPYSPGILIETDLGWQEVDSKALPQAAGVQQRCFSFPTYLGDGQCTLVDAPAISGSHPDVNDDRFERATVRSQATIDFGRRSALKHRLRLGFVYEDESLRREPERDPYSYRLGSTTTYGFFRVPIFGNLDGEAEGTNWGLSAEYELNAARNLTVTAGLRVDREEIDAPGWTPLDLSGELETFVSAVEPFADDPLFLAIVSASTFPDTFTAYEDYDGFERQMELFICQDVPPAQQADCFQQVGRALIDQTTRELTGNRRPADLTVRNTNLSPTLGVAWSPWSDGKTVFTLAAGRHYGRIPLIVPVQEQEPLRNDLTFRAFPGTCPPEGCLGLLDGGIRTVLSDTAVDPDLKTPYQDELLLGFERELWTETSIGLRYVHRDYRDQLQSVNTNRATGDFGRCAIQTGGFGGSAIRTSLGSGFEITDPYTGEVYIDTDPGTGDGRVDDCVGTITQIQVGSLGSTALQRPDGVDDQYQQSPFWGDVHVINNSNSIDYRAVVLELIRRQYRGWEMQTSYTWSEVEGDAEDFLQELTEDPGLRDGVSGHQAFDQRHVFRFAATAVTPGAFRIGGIVRWQSGLPYSIVAQELRFETLPPLVDGLGADAFRTRQRYVSGERNDQRARRSGTSTCDWPKSCLWGPGCSCSSRSTSSTCWTIRPTRSRTRSTATVSK